MSEALSDLVKKRIVTAAQQLNAASPLPYVSNLLDRSFYLPPGAAEYASNTLTPGAAPFEPSFSEQEPHVLRFTIEPLGPRSSPSSRRDEATREMRRLVGTCYGHDALRWFDQRSEEWRGFAPNARLDYGAWFGSAYDHDGLAATKVYYELSPGQVEALPPVLATLVRTAVAKVPNLVPLFTTIRCGRESGNQRITFLHRGAMRMAELGPLMSQLGMGHQLPSLMQIIGIALGGRFELPERSVLLGLGEGSSGTELKLEVLLGMIPDLPPNFLDLLTLGLAERPRQLHALGRWLRAFTPEAEEWPGNFSVLSIRTTPRQPARVGLYLRPTEFEVKRRLSDVTRLQQSSLMPAY